MSNTLQTFPSSNPPTAPHGPATTTSALRVLATALVFALIASSPLGAQSDGQAEVRLREAIHAEVSDGDLERAIEMYRGIVERYGDVRHVAAQALLRMGMSYEKLGLRQAQEAYQELLRDYADQRELAAAANTRLEAIGAPTLSSADGEATMSTGAAGGAVRIASDLRSFPLSISADGAKVAVMDFSSGQNISILDVGTGDLAEVTDSDWVEPDTSPSFYDPPVAWSPDGKRVTARKGVVSTSGDFYFELGIADLDGGWKSVYRNAVMQDDFAPGVWATDWLPDGDGLVGVLQRSDKTYALGVFSTAEESFTPLRSLQWDFDPYESRPDLSPDGRFVVFEEGEQGATDIHIVGLDGQLASVITDHPADDRDPVWSPDGKYVVFLSRRLGSYGLWGVELEEGRPVDEPFLIEAEMGEVGLLDWVEAGLVLSKENLLQDAFTLAVDLESGQAVGDPVQVRYPLTGKTEWATFSPDGRRIAFVHGRRDVVVMSSDGSDVRTFPLPNAKEYPRNFQWLPDGSAVSFLLPDDREQRTIWKLDALSGELSSWPAPRDFTFPPFFNWTGRNDSIFYLSGGGEVAPMRIRERNLTNGEERVLLAQERAATYVNDDTLFLMQHFAVSPDGEKLAFHAFVGGGGRYTLVIDASSGDLLQSIRHQGGDPALPMGSGPIAWSADSRHVSWAAASVDVTDGTVRRFSGLGKDRFEFIDPDATVRSRHWSPDRTRVVFTVQSMSPEVWLMRDVRPAEVANAAAGRR